MTTTKTLSKKVGSQRDELLEELFRRYGSKKTGPGGLGLRLHYWRKKYAWIVVIGGAKALKRFVDILASGYSCSVFGLFFLRSLSVSN